MALLGFKDEFVDKILRGEKQHTIRAPRKIPIRKGEILHLYKRPRQIGMKLLFRSPCVRIEDILIGEYGEIWMGGVGGVMLTESECDALATKDGFKDFTAMLDFWQDRLPFHGQIIYWDFPARFEVPRD